MAPVRDSVDELVKSVSCYNPRTLVLHGYIGPFVTLYVMLMYSWITHYSLQESQEVWFLSVAAAVVVQILMYLFCMWSVDVHCFLAYSKVQYPYNARFVKVTPTENNGSTELVPLRHSLPKKRFTEGNLVSSTTSEEETESIWFFFQKTKYTYNFKTECFEVLKFPLDNPIKTYQEWKGYQTESEISSVERNYGKNIVEMEIPSAGELMKERATAPFFVFQVFCVGLWCLEEFWYYSLFTLFMLIMFEFVLVQQQLRNMSEIRKMSSKPREMLVYRDKKWRPLSSDQLIPGDVVSITRSTEDELVPCDLLLMRGNLIVDESMLTGESVPQMKESIEIITEEERKLDIESDGRLHVLYAGTKVLQHSPPSKTSVGLRSPNNGCIAYVLRTGFNTSQGKLLRTILYGVKRVTANNLETFFFILFLLMFAIAAASYVWIEGTKDPKRNRYKLFLECTLILTSVVPPELPIELSLAVNTSLLSLHNLHIFCTEPFRIPFAGKVEICCFDKTGTLTSDNLIVEGVAGVQRKDNTDEKKETNDEIVTKNHHKEKMETKDPDIISLTEIPLSTIQVIASCHSLVVLDDGLVGDPLEKATLEAIEWNLTKGEAVVPKRGRVPGMKIYQRFHFSSALKRMSVVAGFIDPQSSEGNNTHIACVKGAPETLKEMFVKLPDNYDELHQKFSRKGSRVLALGRKVLGSLAHNKVRDITREEVEKDLTFVGFLIISCPLKPDSRKRIEEIVGSSHRVMMITGDSPLTACHVANELAFTSDDVLILGKGNSDSEWKWTSIDETITLDVIPENAKKFFASYDLCLTGDAMNYLLENHLKFFNQLLPHISVFARVAPKQKEYVITRLRSLGLTTLMCGDGTNDVGALKHAHVGVALISNAPLDAAPLEEQRKLMAMKRTKQTSPKPGDIILDQRAARNRLSGQRNNRPTNDRHVVPAANQPSRDHRNMTPAERRKEAQEQLQRMLKELDDQQASVVKLGDASIAAPFTSKLSSVQCVCHIIKQGRCTLVTTLQMFKILALNALILAYSQSVLYLDGIKFSDGQATLQGLLLAGCFLFISRSKPLKVLSEERPLQNIFNPYTILTVVSQFAIHFYALIYLVNEALARSPPKPEFADLEAEFKPSLLNSTVYIISVALQVSTFAVNYKGHPFMESLIENRPLLWSVVGSMLAVVSLVLGTFEDLCNQFSIVAFPSDFQNILLLVLALDFGGAFLVDRILDYFMGRGKLRRF